MYAIFLLFCHRFSPHFPFPVSPTFFLLFLFSFSWLSSCRVEQIWSATGSCPGRLRHLTKKQKQKQDRIHNPLFFFFLNFTSKNNKKNKNPGFESAPNVEDCKHIFVGYLNSQNRVGGGPRLHYRTIYTVQKSAERQMSTVSFYLFCFLCGGVFL